LPWDREEKLWFRQAETLLPTESCLKQEPTLNSATGEDKNQTTDVGTHGPGSRLRVRFRL